MASSSALPLPLQRAIDSLPSFISSISKARPGLIRAMRSERKAAMLGILKAVLLSTSLQHDGAVCQVNDKWAKPKTVEELAEDAGVSYAAAKRCLSFLAQLGYLESRQIKRKNKVNGQLEVSPGLRFLARKFWLSVGLWELYKQSVAWAKKHCSRSFSIKFKSISLKSRELFSTAKEVLQPVLKSLDLENKKIKNECNKILAMLRERK